MTKEEFFEKYSSLKTEYEHLVEEACKLNKEGIDLTHDYTKQTLGVGKGDSIVEKSTGNYFVILNIYVNLCKKQIEIYMECTDLDDCSKHITDTEFKETFVTEERWEEMTKKQKEDNDYQEYLRLKEKFEK